MSKKQARKAQTKTARAKPPQAKIPDQPAAQFDWLRVVSLVLCVVGLLVAGYLAWAEVTGNETECADTGKINCEAVQNSAYAETFGLPVAVLGLLGYVAILAVLVLEDQLPLLAAYGRTAVVGLALFGTIFQGYLSVIEGTVLDAWCQWCVASAVIITLLFMIGSLRVYRLIESLQS